MRRRFLTSAVVVMTFASVTPAFAMSSESVGKSGNIAETAATSVRENVNVQDAIALAQKVKPFVTYVNGKPVLTTRDAKKIGISEKDLKDIEEGMNFFSSHVTITAVGTAHKQGDVSAEITWWKDQDGIYIQFSPTDIKIGLTVGVVAGIILGLAGFFTEGAAWVIAGAIVDTVTGVSWIWWDGQPVTFFIPWSVINEGHGPITYYDRYHWGQTYI